MSIKVLIEDAELREALKEEAKAVLKNLGRSEAQVVFRDALDKSLKAAADKVLDAFKSGYYYGPYGKEFQEKLRMELREALIPMFRAEVSVLVEAKLAMYGGIEGLVRAVIGSEIRNAVAAEFKKIKEAGEVFEALRGVVKS